VHDQQAKAAAQLRASMEGLRANYAKAMGGVPKSEWNTEANMAKWQKMYQEMKEAPAYKKFFEDYQRLQKELLVFVEKGDDRQGRAGVPAVPHGYV
jgi:hypothetical protein